MEKEYESKIKNKNSFTCLSYLQKLIGSESATNEICKYKYIKIIF